MRDCPLTGYETLTKKSKFFYSSVCVTEMFIVFFNAVKMIDFFEFWLIEITNFRLELKF